MTPVTSNTRKTRINDTYGDSSTSKKNNDVSMSKAYDQEIFTPNNNSDTASNLTDNVTHLNIDHSIHNPNMSIDNTPALDDLQTPNTNTEKGKD
ncbi:unnamed protein product [Rhizophagus irregularis]|uniref:Uncharacterized protein n=1 Tax=Rhizophagus irregularis TaxID=588596 RepID=A0A915Z0D1_9GLOM|nr:unnamed protein product [Rhizophagus irregularis]CAB5357397.1 unnamed protein product [Rhizophagus irregularis]